MSAAPQRILILFAHPAFQRSRVHRQLVRAVRDVEGVTLHDLYEAYPDFDVDAKHEQRILVDHDVYVLEHPIHWYGAPALVKQWIDLVLEYGWAYGPGGDALAGKRLLHAVSAGGREDSYQRSGPNRFTLRELLAPIEMTFRLCGIEYLAPFAVHGTHELGDAEIAAAAAEYRKVITSLRDGGPR
jgi:glutathione-regulated potassium-efflux system ancillary protein KefG